MKQIVFISGKGGTGKTTVVATLSRLADQKMIADCDVDAPNLHILVDGTCVEKEDYYGTDAAYIDQDRCTGCGLCMDVCRFNSINDRFEVSALKCEGCGACHLVCPNKAVVLKPVKTGETYVSETAYGTFAHALLDIGAEGSGKLVTQVRKKAEKHEEGEKWLFIDGSPGTGCVVIASITGADAAVIVTEPTMSGLSDLKRILAVAEHFRIPAYVCINKYDINQEISEEIGSFCENRGIKIIGRIPFDQKIVNALREFKTPVEAGIEDITDEIRSMWERLKYSIQENDNTGGN